MINTEKEEGPVGTMPHTDKGHIEHNGQDRTIGTPFPELDIQG